MNVGFEIKFKNSPPHISKGICGYRMICPLGDHSIVAVADKACFVLDENAPEKIYSILERLFPKPTEKIFYRIKSSEEAKSLSETENLCLFLYEHGFSRNSVIIACGGGAITDSAGFAASIYMRGIRWVSVPTTFLSQIDAGIGGKTGVNLGRAVKNGFAAKNIIGSFWQPSDIILETEFLESLPEREFVSGAGELAKYVLIAPPEESLVLRNAIPDVLEGNIDALTICVHICASIKMKIASIDEMDIYGIREKLNLGHTAGHAFEAMIKNHIPHGNAVSLGLKYALILSRIMGVLNQDKYEEIMKIISCFLPKDIPCIQDRFDEFIDLVSHDKKCCGARNKFILLKDFGITVTSENIPESRLKEAFLEFAEK